MPRKKTVKPEEVEEITAVAPEEATEVEEPKEFVPMVWVETVDAIGRHMIQVPKKG